MQIESDRAGIGRGRGDTAVIGLSTVRAIVVIATLFGLQAADGVDQVALSYTAPFMRRELGVGLKALGAAFTAGYIGTALGAVIFGTLADRIGRKPTLFVSTISFAAGSLCTMLVTTGPQLIAVRLLTGVALGGLLPVVSALVLQTTAPRLRATATTLVLVGTALGSAACGPLVLLIEPRFGWRAIFVVGAVAPAISLWPALISVKEPPRFAVESAFSDNGSRKRVRTLLEGVSALFDADHRRVTLTLWLIAVTSAIPAFFTLSWLPTLAREARLGAHAASLGPAMFSLAGLVVALVVARVVDRAGLLVLVITTALGSAAFIALGQSFGGDRAFLIASGFAGGLSVSSLNLVGTVAGILYNDRLRAGGVGWTIAVMRLGAAVAPGLGGILLARGTPVPALFYAIAVLPLMAAMGLFRLRGSMPRKTP